MGLSAAGQKLLGGRVRRAPHGPCACPALPARFPQQQPQHRLQQPQQRPQQLQQEQQPRPAVAPRRAAAAAVAAAAALLVCGQPAWAELPPGKRAVSSEELVNILRDDFVQRKYLVTGKLTKEIYSDKCHFADARDDFGNIGPDKWSRAVSLLFNGDASRLKLTGDVVLDDKKRTVTFTAWRQVDVFNLPGSPHTPVYTGYTTLTLDPVENIVVDHIETWNVDPNEVTGKIKFFDSAFDPPGFD